MRWFLILASALVLMSSAVWGADAPEPASLAKKPYEIVTGTVTPTPEMWFYQQELRRHDDPQLAVRRNAEFRAAQRRARLASMKWFGLSNQRPRATPTPTLGVYSPAWAGSVWQPYLWIGSGYSNVLWLANQAAILATP